MSRLGLRRPAGEILVLAAAGLAVAAGTLPSVVGSIAVLGPARSLSLNAWHAGPWAWAFPALLAAAGGTVLAGGGWAARSPKPWCWPATLSMVVAGDLCLVASVLWSRNPGVGSASLSGVVLRNPALSQLLRASIGPGAGFYLGVIAAWLATVAALAVLGGKMSGYDGATGRTARRA